MLCKLYNQLIVLLLLLINLQCLKVEESTSGSKAFNRGCRVEEECNAGSTNKTFTTCCKEDYCNGFTGYEACQNNGNSIKISLSALFSLVALITYF
jgi:hypothetical protein